MERNMVLRKSINQKNYMEYSEYSCLENNKIQEDKIHLFTDLNMDTDLSDSMDSESDLIKSEENYIELSNEDVKLIEKKIDILLRRSEQYKRRIESLTSAITNLRYIRLNLEEKINLVQF